MLPAALTSPAFERRLVKFGEFFFLISGQVQTAAGLKDAPVWLAPVVALVVTLIAHQVVFGILNAYVFGPILGRKQTIWYSSQQASRFAFNDKSAAPVSSAPGGASTQLVSDSLSSLVRIKTSLQSGSGQGDLVNALQ